ncbi:MAG: hypothetical protein ACM30G_20080 [Micromonosporaceae bacterium]
MQLALPTMTDRWPWPGDTATERARRIANSLLGLLPAEERGVWTERAHALGETWLGETLVTRSNEDEITTRDAAAMLSVGEDTIHQWATKRHPQDPSRPLLPRRGRSGRFRTYKVADLLEAARIIRTDRAERRRRRGA